MVNATRRSVAETRGSETEGGKTLTIDNYSSSRLGVHYGREMCVKLPLGVDIVLAVNLSEVRFEICGDRPDFVRPVTIRCNAMVFDK